MKQLVQLCEARDVELLILDLRDEDEYQKCRLAPGETRQLCNLLTCNSVAGNKPAATDQDCAHQ